MITIKQATLTDAETLAQLGAETFVESFADVNTPENVALYLAETFHREAQEKELSDSSRLIFIACKESDSNSSTNAVGYLHLQIKPTSMHIVRLYLKRSEHGNGLAHQLMQRAIDVATKANRSALTLGVWEHNLQGQAFYRKWNFERIGEEKFILGKDVQHDFILKKTL